MTRVGVSLVLWRSAPPSLESCLRSLAAQDAPPAALHVLVNEDDEQGGVSRAVTEMASTTCPAIPTVVRTSTVNHGFAGGHNLGIEALAASGARAFLVINPDVVLEPNCLRQLVCARMPVDSLRGPLLLAASLERFEPEGTIDSAGIRWTWDGRHLDDRQGRPVNGLRGRPYPVAGVSGACLYVPRSAWEAIRAVTDEFFDAEFLAYREDAELGLRAARLGWPTYVVPEARALHVRSLRGTGRAGVSEHVLRLGVRNRFLIAFKHGSARPGARFGAPLRDAVVVAGVLLAERSSLCGLVDAWRLRHTMRDKGRRIRSAETQAKASTEQPQALGAVS